MTIRQNVFNRLVLINLCFRLLNHLGKKRKKSIIFLFFLTLFCAFFEMLSMATILPFLLILTEPKKILEIDLIEEFLNLLNYNVNDTDLITSAITFLFIFAILVSMFMRLFLLIYTTRLSFGIGADLGYNIYNKILNDTYLNHLDRNSSDVINGIFTKVNQIVYGIVLSLLN